MSDHEGTNNNIAIIPVAKDETAKCQACGASEIEFDPNLGHSFCAACGAVLEENAVVAEVTFAELANGTSIRQGQFISQERGKSVAPTIFGKRRGFITEDRKVEGGEGDEESQEPSPESREATIAAGKKRLYQIASALNLSDSQVEMAARWLLLALQHQFTRGRRAGSVAAACLYIVCRQEKTPHLLLDFSDVLQTSVYELGGIFLRLVRLLNLEIPLVDPSFYVGRFAAKLEFGDKTQSVANMGLRLVARMKRDWINTGRRPGGVCAAALTIAARMHGFRRSNEEVTRIVHICESTLAKRLEEFAATPSAQLTPSEFEGIWLEQEADPPAFTRAMLAANRKESKETTELLPTPPVSSPSPIKSKIRKMNNDNKKENSPRRQSSRLKLLKRPQRTPETESINLSDFEDDWEVDAMIVTNEAEVTRKAELWMALNKEYLDKMQAKAMAASKSADKVDNPELPTKRKRKTKNSVDKDKSSSTIPSNTPATTVEAVKQAISTKRFSKKINYAALEQLLQDTAEVGKQQEIK